jgi:hypothetical protein
MIVITGVFGIPGWRAPAVTPLISAGCAPQEPTSARTCPRRYQIFTVRVKLKAAKFFLRQSCN